MSGCGNKGNTKPPEAATTTTPTPSPQVSTAFFEEALPGEPLLSSLKANEAFKNMAANLTGLISATVTEQKSNDYTLTLNNQPGLAPKLNRQEGSTLSQNNLTLKGQGGVNSQFGRISISLNSSQVPLEPIKTYIYQPQINISGVVLTSTDQVAIFRAQNPAPFAAEFLKVPYTTKNPSIIRFRISQLSPFPISGVTPQVRGSGTRSNWINVISQRLTTVFQYPAKQ